MKRVMALVSILMLTVSALIGCSSSTANNPQGGEASQNSDEASKEEVNLTFSIWGNEHHQKMYEELIAEFRETHPHINVEIMTVPFTEYQEKLSIMVASKTAPDVGWLAERMIPQFLESDQLIDIASIESDSDYNFSDIYPSTLELYQKDKELYGVPFSTPPTLIFFNKTLFEEKGLKTPLELYEEGNWTYEEFLKAAKELTDPSKDIYGAKIVREWNNWADTLFSVFWAHGTELLSEDGTEFVLNSEEGKQALQLYYDMIFTDQVHTLPGDQFTFESGQIGMFRDVYSYVSNAREITEFEWDVAPMPAGPNGSGTWMGYAGYSVFKGTQHEEEAIELLKFLTSKQGMSTTSQFFVPSRQSVLESDIFLNDGQPSAESIKTAVLDQMDEAKVKPGHKNWQQVDVKIQTLLDLLYTQSITVEELLDRMESEVTPLLNE